jgi:hypothetical protein
MFTPTSYEPSTSNGPLFDRNPTVNDKTFPSGYLWVARVGETSGPARYMVWMSVGPGMWIGLQSTAVIVPGAGGET